MLHRTVLADADIAALFSAPNWIAAMLRFEQALAAAQAEAGVIGRDAAQAVMAVAPRDIDADAVAAAAPAAGNIAIPFVAALTERLADGPAADWVHYGATSQDVIDTAAMLILRDALAVLAGRLDRLGDALADRADAERSTPIAGRTLLQQAGPIALGVKFAGYLDAVTRTRAALGALRGQALALQFGGAVGSLTGPVAAGHNPDTGPDLQARMARRLGLACPDIPWHGSRDRMLAVCAWAAQAVAAAAKPARDLTLLMQTEVAEVTEGAAGGSSTLPHKRNPVAALPAQAAQTRLPGLLAAMAQAQIGDHERAAGPWHAEGSILADALEATGAALAGTTLLITDLTLDRARMTRNLEADGGVAAAESLTFALSATLGRPAAKKRVADLVDRVRREGGTLAEVAAADPDIAKALPGARLNAALGPGPAIAAAQPFIDAVLKTWADRPAPIVP